MISLPDLRLEPVSGRRPDARVRADTATWEALAGDLEGGMAAFGQGRLSVRDNLHLGIGFLAATNGDPAPGRLRFHRVEAGDHEIAITEAGEGPPLICIHGLGGTKASFMTTLSLLAPLGHRVIAIDLPGFGDSSKPFTGGFDAIWYAEIIVSLMDELGLETASFANNSMGGADRPRNGVQRPERVDRLVLLAPSTGLTSRSSRGGGFLRMPLPASAICGRPRAGPSSRSSASSSPAASRVGRRERRRKFLRAYLALRPLRLLRVRATSTWSPTAGGLLDPAEEARATRPVRLGRSGRSSRSRSCVTSSARAPRSSATSARLRPRPADGASDRDPRRGARLPDDLRFRAPVGACRRLSAADPWARRSLGPTPRSAVWTLRPLRRARARSRRPR